MKNEVQEEELEREREPEGWQRVWDEAELQAAEKGKLNGKKRNKTLWVRLIRGGPNTVLH